MNPRQARRALFRALLISFAGIGATFMGGAAITTALADDAKRTQISALSQDVGDVLRARGTAEALSEAETRELYNGSDILFDETVTTGAESRLEMAFEDGSTIMLGDNSKLVIDELVYDPKGRSAASLSLIHGVFRMVSGEINKVPGGTMTLSTPVATIGIRGTDFWGLQEEDKLTMVLIDNGKLEISNGHEWYLISQPLTGVVIEKDNPEIQFIGITPEELAEAAKTVTW